MIRVPLLTWLTYICNFCEFTVAGKFENGSINVSLKATYTSYIYIYTSGIIGVLLGSLPYNVPAFGRKWTMALSSGLTGTSLFLFATVNSRASNIGLNTVEYFFRSMFNAVLDGRTPEAFPARPFEVLLVESPAFGGGFLDLPAPR
jgi:hypothetical protein